LKSGVLFDKFFIVIGKFLIFILEQLFGLVFVEYLVFTPLNFVLGFIKLFIVDFSLIFVVIEHGFKVIILIHMLS